MGVAYEDIRLIPKGKQAGELLACSLTDELNHHPFPDSASLMHMPTSPAPTISVRFNEIPTFIPDNPPPPPISPSINAAANSEKNSRIQLELLARSSHGNPSKDLGGTQIAVNNPPHEYILS